MKIQAKAVPDSTIDYRNSQEVIALLDRVRGNPMQIRYVTKGVAKPSADRDVARSKRTYRARFRAWFAGR